MEVTPTILLQAAANIAELVSISQIFYEQIFHVKVKRTNFESNSEFDRKCQIWSLNSNSTKFGKNWSNNVQNSVLRMQNATFKAEKQHIKTK
jgi:hypothetical protein